MGTSSIRYPARSANGITKLWQRQSQKDASQWLRRTAGTLHRQQPGRRSLLAESTRKVTELEIWLCELRRDQAWGQPDLVISPNLRAAKNSCRASWLKRPRPSSCWSRRAEKRRWSSANPKWNASPREGECMHPVVSRACCLKVLMGWVSATSWQRALMVRWTKSFTPRDAMRNGCAPDAPWQQRDVAVTN